MSSLLIPKEQQTAYQRWEMSSFASDIHERPQEQPKKAVKPNANGSTARNELSQYLAKARQDGFEQGKQEGMEIGLNEAKAAMAGDSNKLLQMTLSFSDSVKKSNEEISGNLLSLALDIAKAMLKSKISANDNVILPVVRDAIRQLPYVQQPAVLMLHPEDIHMVRQQMGDEIGVDGWILRENPKIERGGCMIETGANQVDATNGMRWKRICEALGKTDTWQEK
ncbi:MAG: flagellar assembly protein FliH [Methylophilaceae bacterium]|nr:flagellar assembly protein FliH [Methylophilaceae bacterium]